MGCSSSNNNSNSNNNYSTNNSTNPNKAKSSSNNHTNTINKHTDKQVKKAFPTLGLKLYVFDEFINACGGYEAIKDLTTNEVNYKFIQQLDPTTSSSSSFSSSSSTNPINATTTNRTNLKEGQSRITSSPQAQQAAANSQLSSNRLNRTDSVPRGNQLQNSNTVNGMSTRNSRTTNITTATSPSPSLTAIFPQKHKNQSYCSYLQKLHPEKVDTPTVFISHAWQYKFVDCVRALKDHFIGRRSGI